MSARRVRCDRCGVVVKVCRWGTPNGWRLEKKDWDSPTVYTCGECLKGGGDVRPLRSDGA